MLEAGICLKCKTGKKRASFFKKGALFVFFTKAKAFCLGRYTKLLKQQKKSLTLAEVLVIIYMTIITYITTVMIRL